MSEALLTDAIQSIVDDRRLAGACTLVWQGGKVLHAGAIGCRDVEQGLPIERDSLFRIASMTKPITSTLALMLFDEGRLLWSRQRSEYMLL